LFHEICDDAGQVLGYHEATWFSIVVFFASFCPFSPNFFLEKEGAS